MIFAGRDSSKSMNILGVSCYYHDSAAVLLRDGQLIAGAEEERFSRIKHDFGFPTNAIRFCLETAGVSGPELDYVVFFEKPFRKLDRILSTVLQTYPHSCKVFCNSMTSWMIDKLWISGKLEAELGISRKRILFSEHHLSHAASAFLCSPFQEAAILTVDGVGDWVTASTGVGRGNDIQLVKQMEFPHSIGLLYSAFTAFLGFEVNEGEYKVMGMAPYGQPRFAEKIWKLVHQNSDGSFSLDMEYFCFHRSAERMFNGRFTGLFGSPRPAELPFFTESTSFPEYLGQRPTNYQELCRANQNYADIAASIQFVTEELLVNIAKNLQKQTGLKRLCTAGGVALNSVANTRILLESGFQEIYIQPAAGDSGGALGAALWAHNSLLGHARVFCMEHAYWGAGYSGSQIGEFIRTNDIAHVLCESEDSLLEEVVRRLVEGKVVGWFQGRSEWGPRALGNRSILGDPRNADMKDIVNSKIKFREPFRPFAPAVLKESANEFFCLEKAESQYPLSFMLYVVPVRSDRQSTLPAVTHIDGSARVQTVSREQNLLFYSLIERFGQATGVPVLLNTSFNLRGEPIVNTPSEAYSTFLRSELDCLAMCPFILDKKI